MAKTSNSNIKNRANKYSLWELSAQPRTGFGLCTVFSVTVAKDSINTYHFVKFFSSVSFTYLHFSSLYIFSTISVTFAATWVFTVLVPLCRGWRRTGRRCIRSFSPSRCSSTPSQRRSASRSWKKKWSNWSMTSVSSKSTKLFISPISNNRFFKKNSHFNIGEKSETLPFKGENTMKRIKIVLTKMLRQWLKGDRIILLTWEKNVFHQH